MICTLASATYTYLLDVFSLPDEVNALVTQQTYVSLPYSVFDVLSLESLLHNQKLWYVSLPTTVGVCGM